MTRQQFTQTKPAPPSCEVGHVHSTRVGLCVCVFVNAKILVQKKKVYFLINLCGEVLILGFSSIHERKKRLLFYNLYNLKPYFNAFVLCFYLFCVSGASKVAKTREEKRSTRTRRTQKPQCVESRRAAAAAAVLFFVFLKKMRRGDTTVDLAEEGENQAKG